MAAQYPAGRCSLCAALGGCGGERDRPADRTRTAASWRTVVTAEDRERLRTWRGAWVSALDKARTGGRGSELASFGGLLEPDRALPQPLPPGGAYRCRTIKLGARGSGLPDITAYPWFACRIEREGDVLSFYKDTGSQRPVGLIFDDGAARGIFLGTLMLGDEGAALEYGQDRTRDMVGIVERVADRRWRLALPWPAFESTLDVIELVPAG